MNRKLSVIVLSGAMACSMVIPAVAAKAELIPLPEPVSVEATVSASDHCLYYGTVQKIVKDASGAIDQLWMASERYGEYVMNISDQTVWIDSGNQTTDDASDLREGEGIYVFHGAVATMSQPPQSSAIVVVRNVPMDAGCAQYHQVEAVTLKDGQLTITTDKGGLLIYADQKTSINNNDGDTLTLADIEVGDSLMAWYGAVAESYPAQTHASHLMVLSAETAVTEGTEGTETETDNEILTRAELVSMLHEQAGAPVVNYAMSYEDVAESAPYGEALRWAASEEIAGGYGNGLFGPEDAITREQLAVVLYRYAQDKGQGFTGAWAFPLTYADADQVSDYAYEAMCWMTMNKVLTETEENMIAPQGTVTRAQGQEILAQFMEVLNG